MKDRFDLENEIQMLSLFADNIRTISNYIIESDYPLDEAAISLEGLAILIEMKTDILHDTMCQCFKLDDYSDAIDDCGQEYE